MKPLNFFLLFLLFSCRDASNNNDILSTSTLAVKHDSELTIGLGRTGIMRLPIEMTSLPKLKEIYTNDTMKYIPKPLLKYLQNDYFIEK